MYLIQPDTMKSERRCVQMCQKPYTFSTYEQLSEVVKQDEDFVPVGSVEYVNEFARLNGIAIPDNITYPEELLPFLKRNVWHDKFAHVNDELFVKPAKTKIFTGGIKKALTEIVSPDEDVWVSDVIEIEAEFRYYVVNEKIVGKSRYDDGDDEVVPDDDIVQQIIKQYKNQPAGYAIDVGIVKGETVLIEINDGWALGYYPWGDCSNASYLELITARWKQIRRQND